MFIFVPTPTRRWATAAAVGGGGGSRGAKEAPAMKKNRPNSMQVALALLIFGADKPNEAIHLQPFNPHSTIPAYDPENEQERIEKD